MGRILKSKITAIIMPLVMIMILLMPGVTMTVNAADETNGIDVTKLTLMGVSAAPVISNLGGDSVTYTEGGGAVLLDNGADAVVTDSDNTDLYGGNVTASIVVNQVPDEDVLSIRNTGADVGHIGVIGTNVTYGGTTIGTFSGGSGTNNLIITLNSNATLDAASALIRSLTYVNTNSTDPGTATRTVRVTVNDGSGGTSANADVAVSVVGVNDAPTLSATGGTPTYTENGSAVDLFSGVSVSTVESGQKITQLRLMVSNLADGLSEILQVDGTSLALTHGETGTTYGGNAMDYLVSVVGSTATVTLANTGGISTSATQTVVDGMTYRNTSEAPTASTRVVTLLSLTDSGGTANGGADSVSLSIAATISVVAVNDAPTITAPTSIGVIEDVLAALTGISFADVDAGSAPVTVSFAVGSGTLYANTGGGVTVTGSETGTLTLSGSIANINAFIADSNVSFKTFSNVTANVTLMVSIDDGGNTGIDPGMSGTASSEASDTTVTLSVTPVNDAPTDITLSSSSIAAASTGTNVSVGTLDTLDPDTGDTFTYTLVAGIGDTDNASFNINGTILRTNEELLPGTYSIRVQTKDSSDEIFEKVLTITVTGKPAISLAADLASVDNDIEITFTAGENAAFAAAITGVSFNGHTLISEQYTVANDKITLHPSSNANTYLRTPATANVVITATGYEASIVLQTITAGTVYALEVTTQPIPGAETGNAFVVQPIVSLKDKYGNVCSDGPSASVDVTASATAGTGLWTLGGTTTKAASSGVANFSGNNLTCTLVSSGTGKMTFSGGGKTIDSNLFPIPEQNSSIAPTTAAFDKYVSATNYKDIEITLTLNSNTLSSIKNGVNILVPGTDYTILGNTCTIKKEYLKTLNTGTVNLTFDFSLGADPIFAVTVSDSTPTNSGSSSGSSSTRTQTSTGIEINGYKQDAGTSSTTTSDGKTTMKITVDDEKLDKILQSNGKKPVVSLGSTDSDVTVGHLNGQTVKSMEQKEATLEIKTGTASYALPAAQINIDAVSSQLGSQVELKDIKVSVKIAASSADTVKIVEDTATKNGYQIVVKPVEFEITCAIGNKTVDISKFDGFVERTVAIPEGVDPTKITTGIVLNADGTFRHVPTQIIKIDGKHYAKINSLTNSTYAVVYNHVEFADVANHWAKTAINDMGSRMVVTGVGSSTYEPERSITRAEFAAIIVRAMGLAKGNTESNFSDVTLTEWYNGYIDTATAYSVITGYDSTSYGPNDTITREQAMAIMSRAMKLSGQSVSLTDSEVSTLLSNYTDGETVSSFAMTSAAVCLKTGIISGTSTSTISPKAYVTRTEVAVMVQRLLQKSNLI